MPRAALLALAVILAAALALRADSAALGYHHLSADERAYGRLALALSTRGNYGDPGMPQPTRWAPGAPVAFAAAHRVLPGASPRRLYEVPEARVLNVILGAGAVLAVSAAAAVLGGPWAAVAAAAAVAVYPPLIHVTTFQLSEPLGALLFVVSFLVLALGLRRRGPWTIAAAGALLGLTVLVRADLVLAPVVVAIVLVWSRRREGARTALRAAGLLLAGALATMLPWVVFVSLNSHHLVPVSDGGPGTLYIGTYLPGDGTLYGFKHRLAARVSAEEPRYRHAPPRLIPAGALLSNVARHYGPGDHNAALMSGALDNLRRYALGDPLAFAWMMVRKVARMWLQAFRTRSVPGLALHFLLLAAALAGLVVGIRRTRDPVLIAIAAVALMSTAVNALLIAESRHNLPLFPALLAAGAAGWALRRGRPAALDPELL